MNIYGKQKFTTEQTKQAKKFCNGFQVDTLKELKAILGVVVHHCDFSNPHPELINSGQSIALEHFLKRGLEVEDLQKWSKDLCPILGFSLFSTIVRHDTDPYKQIITVKVTFDTMGLVEDLLGAVQTTIKAKIVKQLSQKQSNKVFPHKGNLPDNIKWGAFSMWFTDTNTLHILVKDFNHDAEYGEMGFEDKRSGKSNIQWGLLQLLAHKEGRLTNDDPDANDKIKQYKKRLAETLKIYFEMDTDPFETYSGLNGYKTRFRLSAIDGALELLSKTPTSFFEDDFDSRNMETEGYEDQFKQENDSQ